MQVHFEVPRPPNWEWAFSSPELNLASLEVKIVFPRYFDQLGPNSSTVGCLLAQAGQDDISKIEIGVLTNNRVPQIWIGNV